MPAAARHPRAVVDCTRVQKGTAIVMPGPSPKHDLERLGIIRVQTGGVRGGDVMTPGDALSRLAHFLRERGWVTVTVLL